MLFNPSRAFRAKRVPERSPMSKKPAPITPTKEKKGKPAPIDTASGTITVDGVVLKVVGRVTLQTFKIDHETPTLMQFDGEMTTKPKVNKQGPMLDTEGNPAFVTIARVVKPSTGEVGQIVCGAVLSRALKEYAGGYVGKQFVLTKHEAEPGKAKPWTIVEVTA